MCLLVVSERVSGGQPVHGAPVGAGRAAGGGADGGEPLPRVAPQHHGEGYWGQHPGGQDQEVRYRGAPGVVVMVMVMMKMMMVMVVVMTITMMVMVMMMRWVCGDDVDGGGVDDDDGDDDDNVDDGDGGGGDVDGDDDGDDDDGDDDDNVVMMMVMVNITTLVSTITQTPRSLAGDDDSGTDENCDSPTMPAPPTSGYAMASKMTVGALSDAEQGSEHGAERLEHDSDPAADPKPPPPACQQQDQEGAYHHQQEGASGGLLFVSSLPTPDALGKLKKRKKVGTATVAKFFFINPAGLPC